MIKGNKLLKDIIILATKFAGIVKLWRQKPTFNYLRLMTF